MERVAGSVRNAADEKSFGSQRLWTEAKEGKRVADSHIVKTAGASYCAGIKKKWRNSVRLAILILGTGQKA